VIDWEFPEDTFVNAHGDAPVSYAPAVQVAFSQGMFMAGARMTYAVDPLRAVAAWYTGFSITVSAGINQWGEPIADITPEINATGAGARPDMDGVHAAGAFFATMSDCGDAEDVEAERPFLYLFRNLFDGSYGHGKYRGGAGVGFGFLVHGVPRIAVASMGFGSRFPATLGIFGGRAAPPIFVQTVRGANTRELLAAGGAGLPRDIGELYAGGTAERGERDYRGVAAPPQPFAEGDAIYVPITGGAGYGDVLERDPEAVLRDLRDGVTNHSAAAGIYRVAYDRQTLRLDADGTRRLRDEARAERRRRAKPYDEFLKEWVKLRPRAEILRHYGEYPDPGVARARAAAA
jgi:acetophenone carboxylase